MKNELDPLTLPAARGARLIALERLDAAGVAADALASDPRDLHALHDLRVALRRMRSWLRAFKPELRGGAGGKDRRRLRELVGATSRGRDADVQIKWLQKVAKRGDLDRKHGAERLIDLIKRDRRTAGTPFSDSWLQAFEKERARLETTLSTVSEPVRAPDPPPATLAATIAARLPSHVDALRRALAVVHSADDEREAHEARIAAKRLRYLLEPADDIRGCKSLLAQLKKLQSELGKLHDAHLLGHRVEDAIVDSPGPDAAALQSIAKTLAADRATLYAAVERRWLAQSKTIDRLTRSVELLCERLARRRAVVG
jgi:CHAD domain-containing protein